MDEVRCGNCKNPCVLCDLIQDRPELRKQISLIRYERRDLIYQEGTPILGCYIICKGRVKLVKHSLSGKKQLLKLFVPGEILGKADLLDKKTHSVYARTLEESWIAFLDRRSFLALIRDEPLTAMKIAEELSQEINALRERLVATCYSGVRDRLIHILLSLEQRHSYDGQSGCVVVDVTHNELAQLAGIARETVSRQLSKLKGEGLICFDDHKIVIPDMEELRASV